MPELGMDYGIWTDRRFTNIEREVRVTTVLERDGTRYNCYSTEEQIKYHGRKVCSARTALRRTSRLITATLPASS